MQDLHEKLEKYRLEAEDCEIIGRLAGDVKKRAFFARLAVRFRTMARDIEEQIAIREGSQAPSNETDTPRPAP